jgi:ABC-type transport system involved in multi-copper enzyme maturation permease subunit
MKTWTLIADGLLESRRKVLFWIVLGLSVLTAAGLGLFQFRPDGLHMFGRRMSEGYDLPTNTGGTMRATHLQIAALVLLSVESMALGMVGMVLFVVVTAGFVPSFLRGGRVDLTLARPVRRWHVLIGKYAGGLLFVAIQAGIFVVLTFLVVSLNSGHWFFGYLLVWPLVLYQFACLYAFSVLIGVVSKSAVASIFATLGFSVACYSVNTARTVAANAPDWPQWVRVLFDELYWVLPKIQDVGLLAQQALWAELGSGRVSSAEQTVVYTAHPVLSVLTSLGFAALILGVAIWRFARSDY